MALTMDRYYRQLICKHRWRDEGKDRDGDTIFVCAEGCSAETHGDPHDFKPETPKTMRQRLGLPHEQKP